MQLGSARLLAPAYVALLITSCGPDRSLSPDDPRLLASRAAPAPAPPLAVTATAVSSSQVDVAWQDRSDDESGFEVYGATTGMSEFTVWATTGPGVTSYSFTGLASAKEHCVRVRAFAKSRNQIRYSAFSDTACATTPSPPPTGPRAPSGTVVSPAGSDRVLVAWVDNSDDEEFFRVEHAPTSGGPWAFVGTWLGSGYSSYTASDMASEQQVCYRVSALNDEGESAPSNVDCTTPPAAPSDLAAVNADGPTIDLRWMDNSSVEDGYEVHRASPGEPWSTLVELPANTTNYRDAAVIRGKSYWYEVRATKDGGFSGFANGVTIVAGGVVDRPAKPSLEQPQGYYLGTMFLQWRIDPATVDSVKIERCHEAICEDADFNVIATVGAETSSMYYQDWGLADWTIYTYRIRSTNQVGDSEPSDPVHGRTCIDEVDWESPCYPPLP